MSARAVLVCFLLASAVIVVFVRTRAAFLLQVFNILLFGFPPGRYIATPPSCSVSSINSIGSTLSGSLFSHMIPALHLSRNNLRPPHLADSLSSQNSSQLPGQGEGDGGPSGVLRYQAHCSLSVTRSLRLSSLIRISHISSWIVLQDLPTTWRNFNLAAFT